MMIKTRDRNRVVPPKSALSSLLPVPTDITFWRRTLYSDAVMNPPACKVNGSVG